MSIKTLPVFLTIAQLKSITGFGKTTLYKYQRELDFPRPKKFGNSSRWVLSEVEEWMNSRPTSDDVAAWGELK